MENSNISLIQTNKRIVNKEIIFKNKSNKSKCIKISICYGLTILILVNIILFSYIILFQKKSSNNNGIKYIITVIKDSIQILLDLNQMMIYYSILDMIKKAILFIS